MPKIQRRRLARARSDAGAWGIRGGALEISPERRSMRVRIRGPRTELTDQLHDLVHRRAGFAMGRFAAAIREVSLLLAESGEAGCHERIRCSVSVRLARGNGVRVVRAGGDVSTAVDAALEGAARAVQRKLELERRGFASDDEGEPPW